MKQLLILPLACMLFASCNDDEMDEITMESNQQANTFIPLTVGNYWVYQVFKIDSLGNEELLPDHDTISIVGDTMINNEVYYTWSDNNFGFESYSLNLRDSSGDIVDAENNIRFSSTNFTDVLFTSLAGPSQIEYSMEEESKNISVPVGNFECLNYKGIVSHIDPTEDYPERTLNNYYSENIGLVSSNIFYFVNRDFTWERRLIEYNVQ